MLRVLIRRINAKTGGMPFRDPIKRRAYHRGYNQKWVPAHPGFRNKYNWKQRGLNPIEADKAYNSASSCGICGRRVQAPNKQLDHDHRTKRIRGVLCANCNHALGLFHDDRHVIERAMKYLLDPQPAT